MSRARHIPPQSGTEVPDAEDPIDTFCGPVWVGGCCLSALVSIVVLSWLWEVIR